MTKLISFFLVLLSLLHYSQSALAAPAATPGTGPNAGTAGSASVASKKGRIVVKSAIYGLGGGLVVGLASQVFKKKTRNIFMFGSLGMYAGIAMGIYVISTSSSPKPYEGPDTYEDFSMKTSAEKSSTFVTYEDKQKVEMNLLSLSF